MTLSVILGIACGLTARAADYVAQPAGTGPHPAVLLLHDDVGMNTTVRVLADSLAHLGFYVLAPDLSASTLTASRTPAGNPDMNARQAMLNSALSAYRSLQHDASVADNQIGVFGMGIGGTLALRLAAEEPRLRACVAWYPQVVNDLGTYRRITSPLLTIFGDYNVRTPRDEIAAYSQELAQAGVHNETVTVQAAPRFADTAYGADYNPAASAQAWQRTIRFLATRIRR